MCVRYLIFSYVFILIVQCFYCFTANYCNQYFHFLFHRHTVLELLQLVSVFTGKLVKFVRVRCFSPVITAMKRLLYC